MAQKKKRCRGLKQDGKQCSKFVAEGSEYCRQHQSDGVAELNIKQNEFIDLILAGSTRAEAYRSVYRADDKAISKTTLNVYGYKLANQPAVAAELARKRASLREKADWQRLDSVDALVHLIRESNDKATKLKAIAELNKLLGYYEPDRIDHTSNGQTLAPVVVQIVPASEHKDDK